MKRNKTVLVASRDSGLADVRKNVLEQAGFTVISASSLTAVTQACEQHEIDLVMLGYSLPAAEKRRVLLEVRQRCEQTRRLVPVLELQSDGEAELLDERGTLFHQSHTPEDFLQTVESILNSRKKK